MHAMNASGSHLMDAPFTQKITWSYDYTIPIIIICVLALIVAGIVFFVLRRRSSGAGILASAPSQPGLTKPVADDSAGATRVVSTRAITAKRKNLLLHCLKLKLISAPNAAPRQIRTPASVKNAAQNFDRLSLGEIKD